MWLPATGTPTGSGTIDSTHPLEGYLTSSTTCHKTIDQGTMAKRSMQQSLRHVQRIRRHLRRLWLVPLPTRIKYLNHVVERLGLTTGASHASHLGCPSAYSSRVSYIKKRQVWKSRSKTDWPHLGIMPGFSTEKNRGILMLTSTCWQEISLSNTVELTTITPQKQKICRFKRRFLPVFENSRGSIVSLCAANPVTRHDWVVLFLRTSAGDWFRCPREVSESRRGTPWFDKVVYMEGSSANVLYIERSGK